MATATLNCCYKAFHMIDGLGAKGLFGFVGSLFTGCLLKDPRGFMAAGVIAEMGLKRGAALMLWLRLQLQELKICGL